MPADIQYLLFIGFAGMLFLLRLDARRFGAAEWDDERGGLRAWLPRLSWYVLGLALALLVFALHPQPVSQLNLELGADRQTAIGYGIIYAVAGTVAAFLVAWLRYGRITLPPATRYPGAVVGSIGTAFIDEFLFRGVVLGLLLGLGLPGWTAVLIAALIYVGSIRASAGGQGILGLLLAFGLGVAGGALVLLTGGIGAAVVGHAATRFALFMFTGRRGSAAGRRRMANGAPMPRAPGAWNGATSDRSSRGGYGPIGQG